MQRHEPFKVRSNVLIQARDLGGRLVYERMGSNIFLDQGRTWLAQVLGYDTTGYVRADPPAGLIDPEPNPVGAPFTRTVAVPATTAGVRMPWLPFYIGLGVGGNQQLGPMPANIDVDYAGTNVQSDADPTVTGLERPVRVVLDLVGPPVYARWLVPVLVSYPVLTPYTYVRFTGTFSGNDINLATRIGGGGGNFASVPLAEAALYSWTDDADFAHTAYPPALAFVQGQALAYYTFPTLNKTLGLVVTVQWDLIFV